MRKAVYYWFCQLREALHIPSRAKFLRRGFGQGTLTPHTKSSTSANILTQFPKSFTNYGLFSMLCILSIFQCAYLFYFAIYALDVRYDRSSDDQNMLNCNKICITGVAGFIGSCMADRLVVKGQTVSGYDNFSTGQMKFIEKYLHHADSRILEGDMLDLSRLKTAMKGCDFVFHFAANADVRFGLKHPSKDLEQNTQATFNVLEAMRANGISKIAFSSTGSVYGEATVFPTPEDSPFPIQTSLYGASKLAGESLIQAYCEGFGFQAWIFRFVSILGERYTHGHVFDFYKQLKNNPKKLKILGNGKQRKSYLYVQDCLDAMLLGIEKAKEKVNIFNLGVESFCEVNDSIGWICKEMGVSPELEYSGGDRGWVGDNPFIFLDTKKIQSLGWKSKISIQEGVVRTVRWLRENEWVLEARS